MYFLVLSKHKFIKIINETNIIEMLEIQKEEAVEVQNYEEAAQLKKILDRLRNGFIDDCSDFDIGNLNPF